MTSPPGKARQGYGRPRLKGIIPPIVTPLTPSEEVDRPGMRRLIEYLLGAGVDGIFVLGNTGEFAMLTERERATAIEAAVEAVNGRVPVLAGVSDAGTKRVIANCRAAQKAGADFVVATAAYLGTWPQEWIYGHFRKIVSETGARLLLYNVPPLIPDIHPVTIARLSELKNIVGMKDSADLMHVQDVVFRTRGKDFRVLVGLEYHIVSGLLVGAHGATPSPANIAPRFFVEMYQQTMAGQTEEALALQERANRFVEVLDSIPCWVSVVKTALSLMGICGPTAAEPSRPLSPEETRVLKKHLADYGLLS